jgi:hypothetical protein
MLFGHSRRLVARRARAKENVMKKFGIVILAVITMSIVAGCRASGEVDPHGASSISAPR